VATAFADVERPIVGAARPLRLDERAGREPGAAWMAASSSSRGVVAVGLEQRQPSVTRAET
jgi:hypothetical protein